MRSRGSDSAGTSAEPWIGLGLCAAVVLGWTWEQLVPNPDGPGAFAPAWLPVVAAGIAVAGIMPPGGWPRWLRVQGALRWIGLLLLVWTANGLPFDLLTAAGLMGHRTSTGEIVLASVYWPAVATRASALAAAVVLARRAMSRPDVAPAGHAASWYGYVAFLLALPYPVFRVHWALGGTLGLQSPGAAGQGWEPVLIAIPWMLAAALSLLLAAPPRWVPRRLLLPAGWSATAIVAMIGPAAFWSFVTVSLAGGDTGSPDIEVWVFGLFYGSWFLWAIAGGAATRAYQLRSAAVAVPPPA